MNFFGMFWDSGGSKNVTKTDNELIKTPAFGRPFRLGMLYDRVHDTIIPGESLLTLKDIENHTFMTKREGSSFDVMYGDSFKENSAAYNGDANLQLNILKGAASLGCSGKFLKNNKLKTNELRVSLTAEYITLYKELVMEHFKSCISNTKTTATHIVTAIEYGTRVTFTFDRTISEKEDKLTVSGQLKGMVDKIPSLSVKGEIEGALEKYGKTALENTSCKFCGDIILTENPTSYEDAIICYKKLPTYLKDDKAVPVTVWLYPISKPSTPANQILHTINKNKMHRAVKSFENLQNIYFACNELMSEPAIPFIPGIRCKIDHFRKFLQSKIDEFQQQVLGELLNELDLPEQELQKWESDVESMQKWISGSAKTETDLLKIYINEFNKGKIEILAESDVYAKLFENDRVIILDISQEFKSTSEPYKEHVKTDESDMSRNIRQIMENYEWVAKPWYQDEGMTLTLRNEAKRFTSFKSKNGQVGYEMFVTFTESDKNYETGVHYDFYLNGKLTKKETSLPSVSDINKIFDIQLGADQALHKVNAS